MRAYGSLVRDESRRLAQTVESVLALGGVDAKAPTREAVDVAALVAQALEQASGPLAEAEASVETEIDSDLPVVEADATAIVAAVRNTDGPVAIGGGRFSMGGQTAIDHGVQLDMRDYDQVVAFHPDVKRITVQSGMTWRELQAHIDPADLSAELGEPVSLPLSNHSIAQLADIKAAE